MRVCVTPAPHGGEERRGGFQVGRQEGTAVRRPSTGGGSAPPCDGFAAQRVMGGAAARGPRS